MTQPTPAPDRATDPPPHAPACPHCGGGPPIPTLVGTVCKSCARILTPRRAAP